MKKPAMVTLRMEHSTKKAMSKYCDEHGLKLQHFVNAAILKALEASK